MDTRSIRTPTEAVVAWGTRAECFACYEGVVYLGRLVEEDGEELKVIETVACRRCAAGEDL